MGSRRQDVLVAAVAAAAAVVAGSNLYLQAVAVASLHCAFGLRNSVVRAYALVAVFNQTSQHGPHVPQALVLCWGAVCLVAATTRCTQLGRPLLVACVCAPPRTGCAPARLLVVALQQHLARASLPLVELLWLAYAPVEMLPCASLRLYELYKGPPVAAALPVTGDEEEEEALLALAAPAPAAPARGMVTLTSTKVLGGAPARSKAQPRG